MLRAAEEALFRLADLGAVGHLAIALSQPERREPYRVEAAKRVLLRVLDQRPDDLAEKDLKALTALPDGVGMVHVFVGIDQDDQREYSDMEEPVSFEEVRRMANELLQARR